MQATQQLHDLGQSLWLDNTLPVIEETIFAAVPVNVTLLFSREHYLSVAEACLRGIERRIAAGLRPHFIESKRATEEAS